MHPYQTLDSSAFWKTAVTDSESISGISRPKRHITKVNIIGTAGSCFAQHISRQLERRGFNFLDAEPAPALLPVEQHAVFNFGIFSARYGNIYTTTQLRQLIEQAFGRCTLDRFWGKNGRFYDPFRTRVEPNGFLSAEEAAADRKSHLGQVRWMFRKIDTFIFTLGLTEAWCDKHDGLVYPVCPGVDDIGEFRPDEFEFVNFTFSRVYADLTWSLEFLKKINPTIRFILTVSPVPLTATASGCHVLAATTYSKSVLRAVAGQLDSERDDTDYFPSYELIATHPFRGASYRNNLRDVTQDGVERVMRIFFSEFCFGEEVQVQKAAHEGATQEEDLICEEKVLEAYAR